MTRGLGAGSRPDVGRIAAEETLEEIMAALDGSNMVFITAGMGGGTGTGAAPVIARAAREAGILTVGVVTKPFHFEGTHRMRLAEAGIIELQKFVDTLIIIPNQNLFRVANERTTFADAFKMADDVLHSGVRGVTDLMVMPGLINLDFADIRAVMSEMGKAMMGTGEAEGDRRAIDAAEAAISNPLLDDVSMKGARGVLINITGGLDMTLFEVDEAANRIREEVDPDANIIFGSTFDEKLDGTHARLGRRHRHRRRGAGAAAAGDPAGRAIAAATSRPRPRHRAGSGRAPRSPPRPLRRRAGARRSRPRRSRRAAVKGGAFIAPRPVEVAGARPLPVTRPPSRSDAFAAAAMENGGRVPHEAERPRAQPVRAGHRRRPRRSAERSRAGAAGRPRRRRRSRVSGALDPADRLAPGEGGGCARHPRFPAPPGQLNASAPACVRDWSDGSRHHAGACRFDSDILLS